VPSDEVVILVSEFSEGASRDVPSDRTITYKIIEELRHLEKNDSRFDIVEHGKVILDSEEARIEGRAKGASVVIWGVYTTSPTTINIEPHLELLSIPVAVFARGHLSGPEERIVDIETYHSFDLHLELKQEMSYLSAFVAGIAHYLEDRYDEALVDFDVALVDAIDSKSLGTESIYYFKGFVFREQGRYSEAERQFEEAIAVNPRFAEAYNGLGLTYSDQDRNLKAAEQYIQAIEVDPEFALVYNNLAMAYRRQDRPDEESEVLLGKALDLDSSLTIAYLNLGAIYEERGEYTKALTKYDEAIQSNPYYEDAYYYRASLYYQLGRLQEAKEDCKKVLELESDHALTHNLLGLIYAETRNLRKAIKEYNIALDINPDSDIAHSNLGLAYEVQGKFELARAEYEEAVRINPDDPVYHCSLAGIILTMEEDDESEGYLAECKKLVANSSNNASAHNALGMVYLKLEDYPQAVQEFQVATDLEPSNHILHSNLASAYDEMGELQAAIKEAEIALRLSATAYSSHKYLSALRWKFGDYLGALREFGLFFWKAPISLRLKLVGSQILVWAGIFLLGISLYLIVVMVYWGLIRKDAQHFAKIAVPFMKLWIRFFIFALVIIRWFLVKVSNVLHRVGIRLFYPTLYGTVKKINGLVLEFSLFASVDGMPDDHKRAL